MFQRILLIGALLAPIGSAALAEETVAPAASAPAKSVKSTKRHTSKKVSKQGRRPRANSRRVKSGAVADGGQR